MKLAELESRPAPIEPGPGDLSDQHNPRARSLPHPTVTQTSSARLEPSSPSPEPASMQALAPSGGNHSVTMDGGGDRQASRDILAIEMLAMDGEGDRQASQNGFANSLSIDILANRFPIEMLEGGDRQASQNGFANSLPIEMLAMDSGGFANSLPIEMLAMDSGGDS